MKNLNFATMEKDVKELFEGNGIVGLVSTKIIRSNGDSRGYGFVEFGKEEQA